MSLLIFLLRQNRGFFTHPKRIIFLSIFFFVLTSFFLVEFNTAFAAPGIYKKVNFQGKLVNANGTNVADGDYAITFTLYNADTGGSNLWDEIQTVTVADGVFQVELGAVDSTIAAVDFNSDVLYLGVKVESDGEMTPRIRFTTVPYAFNAEKVNGLTVTNTTGTLTIPASTTIQFAGAFTTSGANALTLTTTGTTDVTLPTTGTLITLAGGETLTNKTLTAPKFADLGFLADASGNELLIFDSNATAVNELTISNGGTGVGPTIIASGETNVDLSINSKAAGAITLDSGTTGIVNIGTGNNAKTLNLGTGTSGNTINIGTNNSVSDTINIGSALDNVAITGDDWSLTNAGALTLGSTLTLSSFGTDANAVLYSNTSGVVTRVVETETGSLCLLSGAGASGAPSWGSCPGGSGGSSNWVLNSTDGTLSPINNTLDLLLGGTATSSAKFAFTNVAGALSPIASISATTDSGGSGSGLVLAGSGAIQSLLNQTLTIGGDTTGDIALSPNNGNGSVIVNGTLDAATGGSATFVVAASDSSARSKAQADYVGDGTDDDATIETAIAALPAGGGVIKLLEGTYSIGDSAGDGIDITTNNISLIGSGKGTILQRAGNAAAVDGVVTVTSDFVTIADLAIDGVKATFTSTNNRGISFTGVNDSVIRNVYTHDNYSYGIILSSSSNNTVTGNNSQSNNAYGILLSSSNNNTITGNNSQSNNGYGILLSSSDNNTTTGNNSQSNALSGISLTVSDNNTITGNNFQSNAQSGIILSSSFNNTVTGNNFQSNTVHGIQLSSSHQNSIIGNTIEDVGASDDGIFLSGADNNIITGNNIVDTSGSRYGINVSDSTSDNNYIASNEISGAGFVQEVNDAGTGTTIQMRDQFQIAGNNNGKALLIIDQTNTNFDILSASSSGNTMFTIGQNGEIGLGLATGLPDFGASGECLKSQGAGVIAQWDACGGGSQTPWSADIDADGFDLSDLSNILFRETTGAPAGTDVGLFRDNAGDLNLNVLTGKTFNVQVNGTDEYNFSSTALAMNGNNITGLGTNLTASAGLTIGTGSDGAITLTPNGTGDTVISGDADSNLQLTFGAAPGVDMAVISNTGFGTTTDDVNGLRIDLVTAVVAGARTNAGLEINVNSAGATEASDVVYGINIENITGQTGVESGIRIGTGWDKGLIIESGGSTNSGLVYSGAGRPTKTITLSPEYAGGTLTASGSATITGSMTADASGSAQLNRTYYDWTSTETSLQDYTVVVRVKLPADFDSWTTGTTMSISYNTGSSVTATNGLDVYIYNSSDDSTGRPVYFSTDNVSAKTWTTIDLTSGLLDNGDSPDWDSAGETVAIYLKMKSSGTYNYTQIGDIVINYLAKF